MPLRQDALPLISRAAKVTILSVDGRASATGHGGSPGADIALYLTRHGVKAEVLPAVSGDVAQIGDLILSRAFDRGADLIVMGAYGHSRVREIMLGGATRTVHRASQHDGAGADVALSASAGANVATELSEWITPAAAARS